MNIKGITDDVLDAVNKLRAENMFITKLVMKKDNVKKLASELGFELPPTWNPLVGEECGKFYGIPIYIDESVDNFSCHWIMQ